MNSTKKILIIRLGAIGDVVHSTIIAQAIKEKYPQHQVDFLTANSICGLLKNNKYLTNIIPFEEKHKNNIIYLLKKGLELKKEKYDYIVNLTNSTRNILLLNIASPQNIIKRNSKRTHAVDAFFNTAKDIFEDLTQPKHIDLGIDPKAFATVQKQLVNTQKPMIIFSPGGDNDNKRQGRIWPDENWINLGNELVKNHNASIIIIGSPNEVKLHEQYKKINNAKILSGQLSLAESAALMSICDVFISGDSGPLHIADAVGAKTIALMGSTSPRSCAPYSSNGSVIEPIIECKYCGQKKCIRLNKNEKFTPCISSITVQMVLNELKKKNII